MSIADKLGHSTISALRNSDLAKIADIGASISYLNILALSPEQAFAGTSGKADGKVYLIFLCGAPKGCMQWLPADRVLEAMHWLALGRVSLQSEPFVSIAFQTERYGAIGSNVDISVTETIYD